MKDLKQDPTDNELLTVEDIAARLQLKTSWVYSNAACLGALRLGKYLRFMWATTLERLRSGECDKSVGASAQRTF